MSEQEALELTERIWKGEVLRFTSPMGVVFDIVSKCGYGLKAFAPRTLGRNRPNRKHIIMSRSRLLEWVGDLERVVA